MMGGGGVLADRPKYPRILSMELVMHAGFECIQLLGDYMCIGVFMSCRLTLIG